jgi:putative glycosyltransferase
MSSKKILSIVATLYNSDSVIEEFVSKAITAAEKLGLFYEIVLVNDGSPDTSLEKALNLQLKIPSIVIVDLARNFGHHPAILAGLSEAKGDLIFLIDSDLEEDPAWIIQFTEKMRATKADVVFGQQKRRKGGMFENATGTIFYWVFNFLCETRIPANFVTARLMTRQYLDALLEYGERALFLGGTFVLTGFKQEPVPIIKKSRGTSTYSLYRRLKLVADALTSFSPRPLYLVFAFGLIIIFLSLTGLIYICFQAMFGSTLIGWASVMVSVWLLGGLTLFSIGVVGTYVGKTLLETKQRPLFKVRCVYRRSQLYNRGKTSNLAIH